MAVGCASPWVSGIKVVKPVVLKLCTKDPPGLGWVLQWTHRGAGRCFKFKGNTAIPDICWTPHKQLVGGSLWCATFLLMTLWSWNFGGCYDKNTDLQKINVKQEMRVAVSNLIPRFENNMYILFICKQLLLVKNEIKFFSGLWVLFFSNGC